MSAPTPLSWGWLKPGGTFDAPTWAKAVFRSSTAMPERPSFELPVRAEEAIYAEAPDHTAMARAMLRWPKLAAIALALLLSAGQGAASAAGPAEDPVLADVSAESEPHPAPAGREFSWSSMSYSQTLIAAGIEDRHVLVGARVGARVPLPLGLWLAGRADASALGDGQTDPGPVDILKPDTYSTLEAHLALWGRVWGPVSVVAIVGGAAAIEAGGLAPSDRYPMSGGGGFRLDYGDAYLITAAGVHESSGSGPRLLVAAHVPIHGGMVGIADGAIGGQGSFLRVGIGLILGGSR